MQNHGIKLDEPYLGNLDMIQRGSDFQPSPGSTQWDCTQIGADCGVYTVTLNAFVPPQTYPNRSDISGDVSQIDQDEQTYRLSVDIDGFVTGPAALAAVGSVEFEIFCVDCGEVNEIESISPDFKDNIGNISGNSVVSVLVPGIGGSSAPPQGNDQTVRMTISRLGGACNNILPATSSWGLVGLVGLMIATSLFFAGRKPALD
jgi:hypothetical protein